MKLGLVVALLLCAVIASPLSVADDADDADDAAVANVAGSSASDEQPAERNLEAIATLLYNRIAGVPPSSEVLARMVELLE